MKKINIKKIEQKIDRKLKRNTLVIAFDSSAHATGVTILKTLENTLIIKKTQKIEVPRNITELDAVDLFTEQIDKLKEEVSKLYKFDYNAIENCYIGVNPKTGIWLARIGILIYDRFKSLSRQSKLIYPQSARASIRFKKSAKGVSGKKLKAELIDYVENILGARFNDNNENDAIILGLSVLVEK